MESNTVKNEKLRKKNGRFQKFKKSANKQSIDVVNTFEVILHIVVHFILTECKFLEKAATWKIYTQKLAGK